MSKFSKMLEDSFGWCDHDWGKWVERPSTRIYHLTGKVHGCTIQTRACKKCGKTVVSEIHKV